MLRKEYEYQSGFDATSWNDLAWLTPILLIIRENPQCKLPDTIGQLPTGFVAPCEIARNAICKSSLH